MAGHGWGYAEFTAIEYIINRGELNDHVEKKIKEKKEWITIGSVEKEIKPGKKLKILKYVNM